MRLRFKKYFYLLSDLTDLVLKKDREELRLQNRRLRAAAWLLAGLLFVSLAVNIYQYVHH